MEIYICTKCRTKFHPEEVTIRGTGPTLFDFIHYRMDCPMCGHHKPGKPWYKTMEVSWVPEIHG